MAALIAKIDGSALRNGHEDAAVEPLIDELAKLAVSEIEGFAEQLAQVLYDLDGEAYANHAGESGGSGDGFLYIRCFVVACGEKYYARVLAKPNTMPSSLDEWCEPLLYAARRAWARKTGNDDGAWPYTTTVSYESFSNKAKWS